ncbi:MAG: hypothetical protein QHH27_03110 [Clostridia bacterium]|jgi:hypothetical protein|nr:hypothetical protein [Clostridia bacterium]MDH7572526.1 hypothetical protein [Clostridia bacterium]
MGEIQPGKCPIVDGVPQCPPPTEIDCIEVLKVYDQCIKEEIIFREVPVPKHCHIDPTDTIVCEVVFPDTTCSIFNFGEPDPNNFRSIVIKQTIKLQIRVFDSRGHEKVPCRVTEGPFQQFQDVFLYAPEGTFGQCRIVSARCECSVLPRTDTTNHEDSAEGNGHESLVLFCKIKLCKEIQVKALVKLLVPSYGFCQAEPCVATPQEEFPCPPQNLFPPQQCEVPDVVVVDTPEALANKTAETGPEGEVPRTMVQGIVVTVTRGADVFDAITDADEVARFPALVGGFKRGDVINAGGKEVRLPVDCCRVTFERQRDLTGQIVRTLVYCDGRLIRVLPN